MRIVIIGSGNVATHLAFALKAAQMEVIQIWSNQYHNAVILANQVGAKAIHHLNEIDETADICILAVKDDAIAAVADQLAGFGGIVLHTSGSVNMDVFTSKVNDYGVFYPLQTFSKGKAVDFKVIPICIEAKDEHILKNIKQLAKQLSNTVVEVDSEKRQILHLAAVFACNFANHLYALSELLLKRNDLDLDLLRPLIMETAVKVQDAQPINVQTGPAIRNDEQTLKKHERLLSNEPQLLNIYQTLSESIKKMQK